MTLPETMRVLGQRSFGGVEVLEELTMPLPPAEGADLLVRMEAVGINPVDAKVRSNWGGFGEYQCGQPVITGWDGAGVVVAIGPEADGRFETGDPVMFAGSVARAGCQREYALVDSRLVGRRPTSLRPAEAAALPLTSLTVWEGMIDGTRNAEERGPCQTVHGAANEPQRATVLVVGGAGGVGSNAIQILRQLAGCRRSTAAKATIALRRCAGALFRRVWGPLL